MRKWLWLLAGLALLSLPVISGCKKDETTGSSDAAPQNNPQVNDYYQKHFGKSAPATGQPAQPGNMRPGGMGSGPPGSMGSGPPPGSRPPGG